MQPKYRNGKNAFPIDCDTAEVAKEAFKQLKDFKIEWVNSEDNTTRMIRIHPDTPLPIRIKKKLIGGFWSKLEDHLKAKKLMRDDMKIGATPGSGTLWVAEGECLRTLLQISLDESMVPTAKFFDVVLNRYNIDIASFQELADQQRQQQLDR